MVDVEASLYVRSSASFGYQYSLVSCMNHIHQDCQMNFVEQNAM
jgi:hypothetical protein